MYWQVRGCFIFSNILVANTWNVPLSTNPSKYVNYESAVNPEYYNRKIRFRKTNDYGELVLHRKLGLSKPSEKHTYQHLLNKEFKRFSGFFNAYICSNKNLCDKSKDYRPYLVQLKAQNVLEQERFFAELSKQEFKDVCLKIVEIYEKYFDIGYCHFSELQIVQRNLSELYEMISFKNKTEFNRIVDLIVFITDSIKQYKKQCI